MIAQIVIYHKMIEEIIRVQRELDFVWTVIRPISVWGH